jgi:gag-polypeptide of LTR copia-type
MSSDDKYSSVKTVVFNGKPESWDNWDFGFVARSVIQRYDQILSGDVTCPTREEYLKIDSLTTDPKEKAQLKAYAANSLAFSNLVSSMDQKGDSCAVAIGILKSCRTTDIPGGDAYKGITALRDYYNNKSVATVQSLLSQYHGSVMKANQDPAEFIYELENLRAKIVDVDSKRAIDDESFILRLLNTLPAAYTSIVEDIERDLNKKEQVTIPQIRDLLHLKWQRNNVRHNGRATTSTSQSASVTSDERALFAGGFKGKCTSCGKYGHKGYECRSNPNNNNANRSVTSNSNNGNRFQSGNSVAGNSTASATNMICNYCKKGGHWKSDCPVLKARGGYNPNHRPNGNSGGGSNGGNNGGGGRNERAEVVLTVVEKFTAIKMCDRCCELGFLNRPCHHCLVGQFVVGVPTFRHIGMCELCKQFGEKDTPCECDDDGEGFFVGVDMKSIHLDDGNGWETSGFEDPRFYDDAVSTSVFVTPEAAWFDNAFEPMLKDIVECGHQRFNLNCFLMHVGRYIYTPSCTARNSMDLVDLYAEEWFVNKYGYNLVNIGIESVTQLVQNINVVNDALQDASLPTLEESAIEAILFFAPTWLKAEYRYSIRREVKLPTSVLEQLSRRHVVNLTYDYDEYQAEFNDGIAPIRAIDTALVEYSFFAMNKTTNHNLWVGDSGASCHMTNTMDGMINVSNSKSPIQIGTGDAVESTRIGDKRLRILQADGEIKDVVLKNCKYVPQLFTNLFSITKASPTKVLI